ncbi:MAG: hypothetical protein ACD_79C00437G0004 [uncultured bacterium]|nr:MAG: hypothetical protein ACD_79C00437G0004 [uncultured bacterium]
MKKSALIILAEGFEEIETVTPIDILRRCGVRVVVAGLNSIVVKGARDMLLQAECLLKDVKEEFDLLILPGGSNGATNLKKSEKVMELINVYFKNNKLIGAICASPAVVLGNLAFMEGRNATCFPGCEEYFSSRVIYKKEDVVEDGNIISSRGPGTAFKFSLVLAARLVGEEIANKIGRGTLYL